MSTLKIQSGMALMGTAADVPGDTVTFVAEDGRPMFEVVAGRDGRSIEVRGAMSCKVGGVVYGEALHIHPRVSNVICVYVMPWDAPR